MMVDDYHSGYLDWAKVGPSKPSEAPTGAGTTSVPLDPSPSSSPSFLRPSKVIIDTSGKESTTSEKYLDLLGPLPSFLDGTCPFPKLALS
ncbi:hypothetical protein O181_052157 [Austropuccinia psidii MF-1]|uniref:Uncharacterized protein n=1 Tax=Austropuccinia psidii MF-1 TaxID=1389203 RepID=A0A9Q3HQ86_9BASI|nr:hypothetical protein [Austropuccinia psidii MF-1]